MPTSFISFYCIFECAALYGQRSSALWILRVVFYVNAARARALSILIGSKILLYGERINVEYAKFHLCERTERARAALEHLSRSGRGASQRHSIMHPLLYIRKYRARPRA